MKFSCDGLQFAGTERGHPPAAEFWPGSQCGVQAADDQFQVIIRKPKADAICFDSLSKLLLVWTRTGVGLFSTISRITTEGTPLPSAVGFPESSKLKLVSTRARRRHLPKDLAEGLPVDEHRVADSSRVLRSACLRGLSLVCSANLHGMT